MKTVHNSRADRIHSHGFTWIWFLFCVFNDDNSYGSFHSSDGNRRDRSIEFQFQDIQ